MHSLVRNHRPHSPALVSAVSLVSQGQSKPWKWDFPLLFATKRKAIAKENDCSVQEREHQAHDTQDPHQVLNKQLPSEESRIHSLKGAGQRKASRNLCWSLHTGRAACTGAGGIWSTSAIPAPSVINNILSDFLVKPIKPPHLLKKPAHDFKSQFLTSD